MKAFEAAFHYIYSPSLSHNQQHVIYDFSENQNDDTATSRIPRENPNCHCEQSKRALRDLSMTTLFSSFVLHAICNVMLFESANKGNKDNKQSL